MEDSGVNQDDGDDSEFVETDPTGRYGRYKEILGRGAYKSVYKAFDEVEGIEVAWNQVSIRDIPARPEEVVRLYSEVNLLKSLKHKNIIKFYTSWVDAKEMSVNFITEIFTSGTLRQYRMKHKKVDVKALKNWARQILRGLRYLHTHDPPIIHRDIKCDNIFVNGNSGEVKIGDLGLATIMMKTQHAHSVIGTPEFMAPEFYEEEYNELVDIYAFGMCVLELVTLEYPYCECMNAAQIYRKVSKGVKPAGLQKVKDPEVRSFIEKCLAPASERLSAQELLEDPFLRCETPGVLQPPPVNNFNNKNTEREMQQPVKQKPELIKSNDDDETRTISPYTPTRDETPTSKDFTMRGTQLNPNKVCIKLRIAEKGVKRAVQFEFDLEADSAISVASEMVAELDLSGQDVNTVAEMIDAEVMKLVPDWVPGGLFDEAQNPDTSRFEELPGGRLSSDSESSGHESDGHHQSEMSLEDDIYEFPLEVTSPATSPSTTPPVVQLGHLGHHHQGHHHHAQLGHHHQVLEQQHESKQDMVAKWVHQQVVEDDGSFLKVLGNAGGDAQEVQEMEPELCSSCLAELRAMSCGDSTQGCEMQTSSSCLDSLSELQDL